jgi:hypothetical protein
MTYICLVKKQIQMNQVQVRFEVHQMIDRLDEHLLAAVHSMLATYEQKQEEDTIIGYDIKGTPLLASQLRAELLREIELVEQGNFMSIEALEKESGNLLAAELLTIPTAVA